MWVVQKKDFAGNWFDIYCAQSFTDADNYKKQMATDSSDKSEIRIINK